MSRELICSVLGVPIEMWPPDHYTLIGLRPEQADPARVESRVQELSARLRPFQLAHPDEVTDTLNRLAQALVCLSDPRARAAYDKSRLLANTVPTKTPFQLASAFPARPTVIPSPAAAPSETVADARRCARRQAYRRLALLRRCHSAWFEVGRWYGQPNRRLADVVEATDFIRASWNLRDQVALVSVVGFGPGSGGEVLDLVREPHTLNAFRRLTSSQRERLAADWRAGFALLDREVSRVRSHVRRRGTLPRGVVRVGRYLVSEGIDITLFVLGLLALVVALVRGRN